MSKGKSTQKVELPEYQQQQQQELFQAAKGLAGQPSCHIQGQELQDLPRIN